MFELTLMLFNRATLEKIQAGRVTIAFRKWKRPTVRAGGTLVTRIGVLQIISITPIDFVNVSPDEIVKAGYNDMTEFENHIQRRKEGRLHRIEFNLAGEDPRLTLRERDALSQEEYHQIKKRLDRYDKSSKRGPWAYKIIGLIAEHPAMVSTKLAEKMEVDRFWLKGNIRKLKALGLTISLDVGYKLSPRGEAFLRQSQLGL